MCRLQVSDVGKEFLEVWEKVRNPNFNLVYLKEVKKDLGKNRFLISPGKWIETTNAIGLAVKPGRYGGGSFASSIAMLLNLSSNLLGKFHGGTSFEDIQRELEQQLDDPEAEK